MKNDVSDVRVAIIYNLDEILLTNSIIDKDLFNFIGANPQRILV